jgi:hypothetical protein
MTPPPNHIRKLNHQTSPLANQRRSALARQRMSAMGANVPRPSLIAGPLLAGDGRSSPARSNAACFDPFRYPHHWAVGESRKTALPATSPWQFCRYVDDSRRCRGDLSRRPPEPLGRISRGTKSGSRSRSAGRRTSLTHSTVSVLATELEYLSGAVDSRQNLCSADIGLALVFGDGQKRTATQSHCLVAARPFRATNGR